MLAKVGLALRTFEHPAAEREVLWDLWCADRVRPLLDDLSDVPQRADLVAGLDRFEAEVRPRLSRLRRQVVHNDLSGDNVDGFEQDLRATLLALEPSGVFVARATYELLLTQKA